MDLVIQLYRYTKSNSDTPKNAIGKERRQFEINDCLIRNIKNDIFAIENEILKIENNIKNEKIWFQAERDEYLEWLLGKVCQLQRNRLIQEENFWLEKKHEIE